MYGVDKRIADLFNVALEYTKDFYFDKQSDIFRYECNLEGKELLKELHISHEELRQYANLISEFAEPDLFETKESKVGDEIEELLERLPKGAIKREDFAANISDEALFSLAAFGDMFETRDFYCENYQKH